MRDSITRSIGEALRDEAHRKLMTSFEMKDWQLEDGAFQPSVAIAEPSRSMSIEVEAFRINIFAGMDNRLAVWIELNAGELIVHAYDDAHEEPVTLRIGSNDIAIDTFDRR